MIIALLGQKGGVGKTSSAVHLAAYLNDYGRTLLIDGDGTRSATAWGKRGSLPFPILPPEKAQGVARTFDHVIFDTQAQPDESDVIAIGKQADLIILPSSPDALALDGLLITCALLKKLGIKDYRALLTLCPPRPSRDADEARAMLGNAGIPLFAGQIQRRAAFGKAALSGTTVQHVADPRAAAAWADYEAIGKELTA